MDLTPPTGDIYIQLTKVFGRIGAFGSFGAVIGTIAGAVYQDTRKVKISFGEWAAYSAAVAGAISIAIELARATH
jgi:hypothetical protein